MAQILHIEHDKRSRNSKWPRSYTLNTTIGQEIVSGPDLTHWTPNRLLSIDLIFYPVQNFSLPVYKFSKEFFLVESAIWGEGTLPLSQTQIMRFNSWSSVEYFSKTWQIAVATFRLRFHQINQLILHNSCRKIWHKQKLKPALTAPFVLISFSYSNINLFGKP